jgi:hypothetical protein
MSLQYKKGNHKKCIYENCIKQPTYNLPTEIAGIYCSEHKNPDMIDVVHKKCYELNCNKIPNFNLPKETTGLYCLDHKNEYMIDVVSKKCFEENCMKRANFNLPTESRGLYCVEHKNENMININTKKCFEELCMKRPNFNLPTESIGLYCAEHKKKNMINVIDKRCFEELCMKRPNFNLPTESIGLYCAEHKKKNMINVNSKKCCQEKCIKQARFNLPSEKKGIYCSEHKNDYMIDIYRLKCFEKNCSKRPHYNLPKEKKGLYCFEHKKENMVNIEYKKCNYKECKEYASFGFLDKPVLFCLKHKEENMINIILQNKCCITNCENEYNHMINLKKYCNAHNPDEKYAIVVKRFCKFCDIKEESTFVCKECKKIQNKKEWAIVRHLRKTIDTKFEYNSSKMLQGCSKKRPDIYFDLLDHVVIVEVDELQHNTYDDVCECARINEIVNGIGGKPIIIIRYNPDTIKNNGKQIIISQKDRIELLVKIIKNEIEKQYETFVVKIIQLFYNDNYEHYENIKEEIITDLVCI